MDTMGTQVVMLTREDSGMSQSVEVVKRLNHEKAVQVRWPTTTSLSPASRVCTLARCRGGLLGRRIKDHHVVTIILNVSVLERRS